MDMSRLAESTVAGQASVDWSRMSQRALSASTSSPSVRDSEITKLRNQLAEATSNIRRIQASYDAAAVNDETLGLWSKVENLSARQANSLEVRRELRQRSRHEAGNGSHMHGITQTLATDMVGTGPQLQVLLDDENECDLVEQAWSEWAVEVGLMRRSFTYELARVVDGEAVGKLITNDSLDNPVKLDLQIIECDLMTTPWQRMAQGDILCDGIEFDRYGRPAFYHLMRSDPRETGYFQDFERVPASQILHWFRTDRPGQCRGIPDLTSALLIFGHLREYDAAVLTAARVAACLSALIHTKASPDQASGSVSPFSATDLEPGMVMGLPDGYDVTQLRAEQPTTTYDAFTQRKLAQACHAVNLPYSIATGDFSKESYAGGRMGRQVYHGGVSVRRSHLNAAYFDRIFAAWLRERRLVEAAGRAPRMLPTGVLFQAGAIPHEWHYDPWEHIDETKAAQAIGMNLDRCVTTLKAECAKRKADYRKVIKQRGVEIEMLIEAGALILPPGTPPLDGTPQGNQGAEVSDDAGDGEGEGGDA